MKEDLGFFLKKVTGDVLAHSGALKLGYPLKKVNGGGVRILMYHRVVGNYEENGFSCNVVSATQKSFEEQMRFLSEGDGYRVISL